MNKPGKKPSPSETRQKILEAAVAIGSKAGYARATTKAIAGAAGVNEITLFRHFGSKANLFSAAIEEYGGPALAPAIEAQLSGEYRKDMMVFGEIFLKILLERADLLRLMLCESTHIPEVRAVLARNPREFRKTLARYLGTQMESGAIKSQHTEALAQAFLGMFLAYAISLKLLDEDIQPAISNAELVAQFVDVFVGGTIKAR
ncbi:MAG: TetR/AcrR family transcriptional regulator [Anaerolineales bacterium]|jgi:AcrR family transcriptional regulator